MPFRLALFPWRKRKIYSPVPSGEVGGGGGGCEGFPKLNVMPTSTECEPNRESESNLPISNVLMSLTLKKRYLTVTSTLSDSAARTPATTCQAKRVSPSSI